MGCSCGWGKPVPRYYRLQGLFLPASEIAEKRPCPYRNAETERVRQKIAAAVYLHQADNDGQWVESRFAFENGTAEIVKLADWDTACSEITERRACVED